MLLDIQSSQEIVLRCYAWLHVYMFKLFYQEAVSAVSVTGVEVLNAIFIGRRSI